MHEEFGTNGCYTWKLATDGSTGVREADVVVRDATGSPPDPERDRAPRGVRTPAGERRVTSVGNTGAARRFRFGLALVSGSEARVRVIAPDVGGGFGSKLDVYAEEALAVALARRLRPTRQMDRGALRGIHVDDPRPRLDDDL